MNSQVFIGAIIFFSTFSTAAVSPGCTMLERQNLCGICYRRKFSKDGVCGPVQSASDPCVSYTYDDATNRQLCIQCKPGYALHRAYHNETLVTSCKKGVISGCAVEHIDRISHHHYCYACADNKYAAPTKDHSSSRCVSAKNPVPHCEWGAELSDSLADGQTCFKCETGFAVDLDTRKCAASIFAGCTQQAGGKCYSCDGENGYFINNQKRCYKTSGTETA